MESPWRMWVVITDQAGVITSLNVLMALHRELFKQALREEVA